jgi:Fibronectin type III domain
MTSKIHPVAVKVLLTGAAVFAVAAIIPNSSMVFGYGSGGGDGLSDGRGNLQACGDSKPDGAPVLLSAIPSGSNQVQLRWSGPSNPVSYYLVTFGTKPGEQLYGNPNVGPNGTNTYTVNGLPGGQRFYFKVRAGNGCMPGDYSNEVSAVSGGLALGGVPTGFQAGVLGAETQVTPTPTAGEVLGGTPTPTTEVVSPPVQPSNGGFFDGVINFFRHLFGG